MTSDSGLMNSTFCFWGSRRSMRSPGVGTNQKKAPPALPPATPSLGWELSLIPHSL